MRALLFSAKFVSPWDNSTFVLYSRCQSQRASFVPNQASPEANLSFVGKFHLGTYTGLLRLLPVVLNERMRVKMYYVIFKVFGFC